MAGQYNNLKTWMWIVVVVFAAAVACGASAGDNGRTSGPLKPSTYNPSLSLAPLVEQVAPAVVNIQTKVKVRRPSHGSLDVFEWFFGRQPGRRAPGPERYQTRRSLGSGFIIDPSGLVVTNRHVIAGAHQIVVVLADDRKFEARVLGSDERTDVALLRIEDGRDLPAVEWGDSDVLRVGDHVVAIGNPFGLDHTVTTGIVSAKERVIGAGPYDDFIQTDASINPGNSGGPLFDLSGRVIGINTAINPHGQGIGFAIPANMARRIIDSLRDSGRVVRGWLGVAFQPLDDQLARAFKLKNTRGAVIVHVETGSPAARAGMRAGDIILEVGDRKLGSASGLPAMVAALEPGDKVPFTVVRGGKRKKLKVEIGRVPGAPGEPVAKLEVSKITGVSLGLRVRTLDPQLRGRLGAQDVKTGVVVVGFEPTSPHAGQLREGDIIVEANSKTVGDADDFRGLVNQLNSGDDLLLRVYRRGAWTYLVLRL